MLVLRLIPIMILMNDAYLAMKEIIHSFAIQVLDLNTAIQQRLNSFNQVNFLFEQRILSFQHKGQLQTTALKLITHFLIIKIKFLLPLLIVHFRVVKFFILNSTIHF